MKQFAANAEDPNISATMPIKLRKSRCDCCDEFLSILKAFLVICYFYRVLPAQRSADLLLSVPEQIFCNDSLDLTMIYWVKQAADRVSLVCLSGSDTRAAQHLPIA